MNKSQPQINRQRCLKIFLSSPGDVRDERAQARRIIERISRDVRDIIKIQVIAWDQPGSSVPMLANMPPQEAINLGLTRPSECEIVIVIFWARMGTPLPKEYLKTDGSVYLSGTEWEYEDAIKAASEKGLPYVLVYRRDNPPAIKLDDPARNEKIQQWERVEKFFSDFRMPDGSIGKGYNQYKDVTDFSEKLEGHIRDLINRIIESFALAPPLTFLTDVIENQEFLFTSSSWPFQTDPRGEDISSKHTVRSKRMGIVPSRQFMSNCSTIAADQMIIGFHLNNTSNQSLYVQSIYLKVDGVFTVDESMFWNSWMPLLATPLFDIELNADKSIVEAKMDGNLVEVLPESIEHLRIRVLGDASCMKKIFEFRLAICFHDASGETSEVLSDRTYHIAFSEDCINALDSPFTGKIL